MKKKVSAVCRSDSVPELVQFNKNNEAAQWFLIPKGSEIRLVEHQVLFTNVSTEMPQIRTGKTTVIGFTPEISIVGLILDIEMPHFEKLLTPKKIVTIEHMELRF